MVLNAVDVAFCRDLGASGCQSLLAVPISFVSEHIETLEEIDMEYRELALESGIREWGRVPALNTDQGFIDDLADAVLEALPYVGSMASAPGDSLVPIGDLEALLEAYDRERRTLPAPVGPWEWGFTKSAETWNGRIAMVAIIIMLLLEVSTGQPILSKMMTID
jgi:ferrochelatase